MSAPDPLRLAKRERDWIDVIDRAIGSTTGSDVGVGDDTAVFDLPDGGRLLFSTDLVAEGIHFDRALSSDADIGWKAVAVNVSDVAAMGGEPLRAVVAIAGAQHVDLAALYEGVVAASTAFSCPVVGGDCSTADTVVISIAVIGRATPPAPVLRSGAKDGDTVFVTGALGSSAAGLRLLRHDSTATGSCVTAHRRPVARLGAGRTAAHAGATAMMDLSDGLGLDLRRLAAASDVGIVILDVPVADGATYEEALGGGEDYELVFTASNPDGVLAAFAVAGLPAPHAIGRVTTASRNVMLGTAEFPAVGYEHQ